MVKKKCPICGKRFEVYPSLSHVKCCSRSCGFKYQVQTKGHPNSLGLILERVCVKCGNNFRAIHRKQVAKYCSRSCYWIDKVGTKQNFSPEEIEKRRINFTGKNN